MKNRTLIATLAGLALAAGSAFAADEHGTHSVHDKPMKSAGSRDGDKMSDAAVKPAAVAANAQPGPDAHCVHGKDMKSAGTKDGDCMANDPNVTKAANATDGSGKAHRVHDKAMKNAGAKDGEAMPNP